MILRMESEERLASRSILAQYLQGIQTQPSRSLEKKLAHFLDKSDFRNPS